MALDDMKDDKIKKIFAQLDRISRKLEYMGKLLEAFDGKDDGFSVYTDKGEKQ